MKELAAADFTQEVDYNWDKTKTNLYFCKIVGLNFIQSTTKYAFHSNGICLKINK